MSISMLLASFLVTPHSTPLWSWFFYPRHADNFENRLTIKPKWLSVIKMFVVTLGFWRLSNSFSTRLMLQFNNCFFSWGTTWHELHASNPKDKYISTKMRLAVIILLRDCEKLQRNITRISEPQEAKKATT